METDPPEEEPLEPVKRSHALLTVTVVVVFAALFFLLQATVLCKGICRSDVFSNINSGLGS